MKQTICRSNRMQRPRYVIPPELRGKSVDEIAHLLGSVASSVKLVTGITNNTAIAVMLDAHDKIRQHPRYRHAVKSAYKGAIKTWHDYESALLHATENRFFHVDDMTPKTRKIYGDITDADYFEFWRSTGDLVYAKTFPLVTSLVNKYRLSLLHHGIAHPELVAWPLAAMVALHIAQRSYHAVIEDAIANTPLPRWLVERTFKDFDIAPLCAAWDKAVQLTDQTHYVLDSTEDRNIEMGMEQLAQAWANPDNIFDSVMASIPEYAEIFRTKGEMKKALREIAETRQATEAELK